MRDYEAYIGFSILIGINPKPAIHHYWSQDPVYHYKPVADKITRDRFHDISRYLHYADNTTLPKPGEDGYDRLGKVRPLVQYLQRRLSSLYTPGQNLAVDEAMIKFQGRSALK